MLDLQLLARARHNGQVRQNLLWWRQVRVGSFVCLERSHFFVGGRDLCGSATLLAVRCRSSSTDEK